MKGGNEGGKAMIEGSKGRRKGRRKVSVEEENNEERNGNVMNEGRIGRDRGGRR